MSIEHICFEFKDIRRKNRALQGTVHAYLLPTPEDDISEGELIARDTMNLSSERDRANFISRCIGNHWKLMQWNERSKDEYKNINGGRGSVSPFQASLCSSLLQQMLDAEKEFLYTYISQPFRGDPDTEMDYLLYPYVLQDGGTILFAPGGSCKSYMMYLWALSIDSGTSTLFDVKEKRRVLIINLERSISNLRRRIGRCAKALDLPDDYEILVINARSHSLADLEEALEMSVKQYGIEIGMLDSISRAVTGDLNDSSPANEVVDIMSRVFPAWVAIGHTPRKDDSHVYGSVMYENAADVVVALEQEQESGSYEATLTLSPTKANDTPRDISQQYHLTFDVNGLVSAELVPESKFKYNPTLATIVAEILEDGPKSIDEIICCTTPQTHSRNQIWRVLTKNPNSFGLSHKEGRTPYYKLIT